MPITELLHDLVVAPNVAPAACAAIAYRAGAAGWRTEAGCAGRVASEPIAVAVTSPFDLASVTKPFVAATWARLWRAGTLELGAALGDLLAEARGTWCARRPVESLLAHRAGLEAHVRLYAPLAERRPLDRARALRRAASAARAECRAARDAAELPPVYSDLGYILAGAAAERSLGKSLDTLVLEQVCEPLGLEVFSVRQWLRRAPGFLRSVVPTETVGWRGGLLRGAVHDDNAWALSGHALSGHAGLFGAAESIARFGAALIDALHGRSHWLDRLGAETLTRPRVGGTLRAGFDGKAQQGSSAGQRPGPRTFGHLGFTGTSFWCDPDAEIVTVLLTNRVRLGPDRSGIQRSRPLCHDALFTRAHAARR